MKQVWTILTAAILARVALSISATYSLISGSPWSGMTKRPSYPSTFGVSSTTNTPGGRTNFRIAVYNNLIYCFHGYPRPSNDVWTFNISAKTWSWIAGRSDTSSPVFGIRGVASISNTPGFRFGFVGDLHRERGEYILFGGGTATPYRGDLWSFSLSQNTWTWLSGFSTTDEVLLSLRVGVRLTTNLYR
eukprot:Partr_v1_DN28864_c3_g1_i2_m33673 putative Inherit from NOG: hedgehog protein